MKYSTVNELRPANRKPVLAFLHMCSLFRGWQVIASWGCLQCWFDYSNTQCIAITEWKEKGSCKWDLYILLSQSRESVNLLFKLNVHTDSLKSLTPPTWKVLVICLYYTSNIPSRWRVVMAVYSLISKKQHSSSIIHRTCIRAVCYDCKSSKTPIKRL